MDSDALAQMEAASFFWLFLTEKDIADSWKKLLKIIRINPKKLDSLFDEYYLIFPLNNNVRKAHQIQSTLSIVG